MAAGDSKEKPTALLDKKRVHEPVKKYMLDTIGMESISDFASYFTKTDFEEGCHAKIVAHTELKDNDMAVGRLRTAWRLAATTLDKSEEEMRKGSVDLGDWDVPLDDTQEAVRKSEFDKLYPDLSFDSESVPASPLVGRGFREFRDAKRQLSVLALRKMRSVADFQNQSATMTQQLTEGVALSWKDRPRLPDITFHTLCQLLQAVGLMCNLWVLTGTEMVSSREHREEATHAPKKVAQIHLTVATSYRDFILRKAIEHPGPMKLTIRWLLERDRQTRAKARAIYAAGYPFGEALLKARDHDCQVLWTCGAPGISTAQLAVVGLDGDVDMSDEGAAAKGGGKSAGRKRLRQRGPKKKKGKKPWADGQQGGGGGKSGYKGGGVR